MAPRNVRRAWLASSVVLFLAVRGAEGASLYQVTTLTDRNDFQPWVMGMNDKGQVLGLNSRSPRGSTTFLYDPQAGGKVTTLSVQTDGPAPAGTFFAEHLNNNGQMIGDRDGQPVLASGGSYTTLPGLPVAVNNNGDVAGWVRIRDGQMVLDGTPFLSPRVSSLPDHSYIESHGVIKDLGTVPGFNAIEVAGLNDNGQAAATGGAPAAAPLLYRSHALVYDGHELKDLGTFGGPTSYAVAINNRGDVIGVADAYDKGSLYSPHAFVSHRGGPLIDLGHLSDDDSLKPTAINDAGQIVGTTSNGIKSRGFLYENGTLTDLSSLLPVDSKVDVTQALAINNKGQIVVEGDREGEPWPRLFLLTPDGQPLPASPEPLIQITPEPGTWAFFGLTSVVLAARRSSGRR